MERSRFRRIKEVFDGALALPEEARRAFVEGACDGNALLAEEVLELLVHARAAGGFLDGSAPSPVSSAPAFLRVPGFEVQGQLAVGASGAVFRALQLEPRREVALKVLRVDALGPGQIARFQREAQILAELDHPGIARVIASGVVEDGPLALPWMALEFVNGALLDEHLAAVDLAAAPLVRLFERLCEAVEHAHQRGIVHRDLKPSNVLVDRTGQPRVIDFGIARALDGGRPGTAARTRTGALLGTLGFMAPEQASGERSVTPAADVYSLGAMLFDGLTGRLPVDVEDLDLPDAVHAIREVEPTPLRRLRPDLPRDLETVLAKALDKDPARRYASAGALADDLRSWLDGRPVRARRQTLTYQGRKFVRRNRALLVGATVVILALAAALLQARGRLASERRGNLRMSALTEVLASKYFGLSQRLGFGESDRRDAEEVIALIEEQSALDPASRPLRALLARALEEMGRVHQDRRAFTEAEACYVRSLALCEELVAEDPEDREAASHGSRLCAHLGEIARDQGDLEARDRWFALALSRDEALVNRHPDDLELKEDLGWSLERVADAAAQRGDEDTALRLRLRRFADAEELVRREPGSWKYVRNLSQVHYYLIDADPGRDHLGECLRLARREVELRPGAREALIWLAQALRAAASRAPGLESSLELALEAYQVADQVTREDPRRADHLDLLRLAGSEVLGVSQELGREALAEDLYGKLRERIEVVAAEPALASQVRLTLAQLERLRGQWLEGRGRGAEARSLLENAWGALLESASADDAPAPDLALCRDLLARVCDGKGPPSCAETLRGFFQPLLGAGLRERAAWFADEIARPAGLARPALPDLAALRAELGF